MKHFIDQCRQLIGSTHVLTDSSDMTSYLTDYRQRYIGTAAAILKPANTEQVAEIVKLCAQHRIAITPQGGNTGLVLGSVPDQTGRSIVLSLLRLNQIRHIDDINNTITVEAGCILQQVQNAANSVDRLFPLSLASEGSCTIGGNLSSNAGGTAVLHYGNCRALCLGLEVVTPQGDIWNGLRALRKDNSGYDLRDVYIGAEGTLGVITAAVLQLFPKPASQLTAFVAINSVEAALALLNLARSNSKDTVLSAFEIMSSYSLALVKQHFPELKQPALKEHPYYVLIEFSSQDSEAANCAALENLMTIALDTGTAQDAVLATSLAQSNTLWQLRESISSAQAAEGKNIKHDISLPISQIGTFIQQTDALLQQKFNGCRMVTFGHLGDGNLHYNVSAPKNSSIDDFLAQQNAINRVVYDSVAQFSGSISAEHGLGAQKRDEILRYKSPVEMQLMRSIKQALDPLNIMNPGKVVQPLP
ncbi:FAD-binding oxidoreductase [Solimicrobium silvestre]|uniref:FAD/FMN-containing dehydrogenase n=1 Tax=Solimicrobium silvestre TaxID=2099400 RepID=A0A2S9GU12_9BURK|nr:FAD-binding oxidoreductase [Solimicrobium silvestre]PRC91191.1 FAD/FMN-containing dehydrogenase [Solimicrobium silvestre]